MMQDDTYRTIERRATATYRDRASRFIAEAVPVQSEEEIREVLAGIRKQYHDAGHHCFAYRINPQDPVHRFSDDGEPSGSAGRPILGQIQSENLTNVLVVVTRYFGGTKLGIPGLIRAYRTSASEALSQAGRIEKTVKEIYEVSFRYEAMNDVMRILKEEGVSITDRESDTECRIRFAIRKSSGARISARFSRIPGTAVVFRGTQ
jgi:uncharacterized YigZ family protein